MGVTGLWKLIEPCGTPVPVETLEGKILAVDISIWLHQVVKGFQDSSGSALAYAHLLGLFHRLCKLLYYRVKPVFVFDGSVPQLKRDTIARRQQQRSKLNNEANRIQNLLLEQLAKEQVVQKALGSAANELLPAKRSTIKANAQGDADEMFKLPELPNLSQNSLEDECSLQETSFDSDEQSSSEDNCASRHYQHNLQAIDVRSQHFRSLPADMRYDILLDIKETRKQSSWGRLHELPAQSDDFSSFQMKRLLKRRAVQESLEEAEQEMGGRTLTYTELQTYFKEEGVLSAAAIEEASRQIASDENTRYLLVRDLKNIPKEPKQEDIKTECIVPEKKAKAEFQNLETESLGQDYEADLQLALALSLSEQTADNVYKSEDYVLQESTKLKLNPAQRAQLRDSAKGPAKSYMIEYAGMNAEEVVDILEKTQLAVETTKNISSVNLSDTETDVQMLEEKPKESSSQTKVVEKSNANNIEVVIDLNKEWNEDDDIFADIFDDLEKKKSKKSTDNTLSSDSDDDFIEVPVELETKKIENSVSDKSEENILICNDFAKKESKKSTDNTLSSDSDDDFIEVPVELETKKIKNSVSDKSEEKILSCNDAVIFDDLEKKELKKSTDKTLNSEANDKFSVLPEKLQAKISKTDVITENKESDANKIDLQVSEELEVKKIENTKNHPLGILEELRLQLEKAKNIDLDKVEIKNDIIEIKEETVAPDIIEINDNTDDEANIMPKKSITTPGKTSKPTTPFTTPRKTSKPNTPSRITDFYERDYKIKRTPEKVAETQLPKVKSPFFRNKTPKSKSPKHLRLESDADAVHQSKAAKKLFETTNETSEEQILQEAAEALKQQKTDVELRSLATGLAHERRELESERNRQDRMGMNITQRMNVECQELLRLFGIPYIVAPMEAEAQCAFLEAVQLTHGTITDDSDIWLFGGRTVYKNFFAQNKHVLKFSAQEIETQFKCDRQTLVQLACLVGSDYTTGIHGIGAVTALEILSTFAASRNKHNNASNIRHDITLIMDTLQRFRDWWQASMVSAVLPGSSTRHKLLKKLRNIEMHEGFPNLAVIEAYLLPKIDESRTAFSWGEPDVESIREFARKTFGWTNTKTNDIMRPVLKRLAEKGKQTTMRNYFLSRNAISVRQLKVSKRVQSAIERLGNGGVSDESIAADATAKNTKKPNARGKRQGKTNSDTSVATAEKPQTSSQVKEQTKAKGSKAKTAAVLHSCKEIIPQREKDLAEMLKNREKAAKLLSPLKKKSKN